MTPQIERRALLLAVTADQRESLRRPFAQGLVPGWQTVEADSFEQARFLLQHESCDVVLVDGLCADESDPGLVWLASQREAAVVLLSDPVAERIAAAMEHGVRQWLPRDMALGCPRLLAATLEQATDWAALRRRVHLAAESLQECRRQVHRVVNLLWEAAPVEAQHRWFTQGYMMERLQEECTRTARFGSPFSVVLGEMHRTGQTVGVDDTSLGRWGVEQITKAKRRCDVVGQYGPHGFILLLMNTTRPGAQQCCRRIRESLSCSGNQDATAVEAVFGLACCPEEGGDSKSLLGRAERALESQRP